MRYIARHEKKEDLQKQEREERESRQTHGDELTCS